jgi:hypothetical protein
VTGAGTPRSVGRFAVGTPAAVVRRFREAIRLDGTPPAAGADAVPPTFPITWLAAPEVRSALAAALGASLPESGAALIHLSQRIVLQGPLAIDAAYWLDLALAAEESARGFELEATITDAQGHRVATLAGRFALVRRPAPAP